MPSVMDIQQQQQQQTASTNASGKSTPPPPSATDSTNADPLTQAILALDKKQRNLGKRKEKLESYQKEAKKGKELHKDQKEALEKYPEVLGQIEVLKELNEQMKKIQAESAKNQKRLSKQAAEEKRSLVSQSLRQYAQIRYLIENRPNSLESEQSNLLDQLSSSVISTDNSNESITRSVDTVLSIYQNAPPAIIKNLTGKTPQEVRDILDKIFLNIQQQTTIPSSQQQDEQIIEIQQEQEQVQPVEQQQQQQVVEQTTTANQIFNDYPLQFDTRNQNIPLDQVMKITTFFSVDGNNQLEDENPDQSNDSNQFIPSLTVVNSNINDQPSTSSLDNLKQQDEQQTDDQWQHQRGNGSANRTGQFQNENNHRNYNRRGSNYHHQSQRGAGGSRGRYDNSYGGGNQRQYNDQNRGRPGHRGGNRGGGYRGYHNNNNNNGNAYQKSAQYQQGHSATTASQQY